MTIGLVAANGDDIGEFLTLIKETVNNSENPTKYLAVDPGKSNGTCGYDSEYQLQFMLIVGSDHMTRFLQQFQHIRRCIVEDYKVYPNKALDHIYSDLETSRVIGRIESWAETKAVDLIKQNASIKTTAYKWLGRKPLPKSNPLNHAMDAHAHFTYWGVRKGVIKLEDLLK